MNAKDRKVVGAALDKVREAIEEIRSVAEGEREKFDNLTEGLQGGERGQAIEAAADGLEQGADELEGAIDTMSEWSEPQ